MFLSVNGERYEHRGAGTIAALLAELGATPQHTALTLNGRVVPSAEWSVTALRDGDTLELLVFVGGG